MPKMITSEQKKLQSLIPCGIGPPDLSLGTTALDFGQQLTSKKKIIECAGNTMTPQLEQESPQPTPKRYIWILVDFSVSKTTNN